MFCHFKQKATVLILVVITTEFEEKRNFVEEFY